MKVIVAGLVVSLSVARAFAICPAPTPKACSSFFESDAVFVGKVLSQEWGDDFIRYRVQVSKVLRGTVAKSVDVFTENASARLNWDIGRTYVVFAALRNDRLESENDCGPLSDPTKVAETVREIELLAKAKAAAVEGSVLHGDGEAGVPGIEIRLLGEDGVAYTAVTDQKGEFHIAVPPGVYRMPIDEKRLERSVYNMPVDLRHLALVQGQCAQVLLILR